MPQYQGVWTLEAQAQAQSNQQWVTDPNFKNTTLLLQADGTGSGSQNQTFLDGSTNNFFITRNGNTTQGSFSPFSQAPGYWSNYFDGSGDYLSMPSATSALALGSGDWTVECFVNLTNYSDNRTLIDIFDGDSSVRFIWRILTTGLLAFQGASGATRTSTTTTVPTNQWVHLAICKASGTTRIFINGIQSNTNYTDTNTYTNSGASAIGIIASDLSSSPFLGYISNFRVVKGTALYAANFNPPTATLTAVTNTSLLTCQSNRFVDNSASPITITANGTPSVQAFGPFAPALQWTPDVVGGSGYFDGTGDYLIVSSTSAQTAFNMGTGDYTTEMWAYFNTVSGLQCLIDYRTSDTTGQGFILYTNGSTLYVYYSGNQLSYSNVLVNTWYHIAVVKSSGVYTLYINGVQSGATWSNSDSIVVPANRPFIGHDGTLSPFPLNGYLAGVRITKGGALYTSTFTPPTTPPTTTVSSGTVSLLLNYTNAGIYDGKMGCVVETVSTAQVSTSPVKYGSGSIKFNGTTDRLTIKRSDLFDFGTGDFTIESWILFNSVSTIQAFATNYQNSTTGWGWQWRSDTLAWNFGYGDTGLISYTNTPVVGTWIHSAISRSNNVLRMFVNGVLVSTVTNSTNMSGTTTDLTLGVNPFSGGVQYFNGYLDDFRITKGVGRYTANFTPPQQALPRQ